MSSGRRCRSSYCYVNSNFLIMLIRGESRAVEFARANRGCLFTSRPHIEEELVFSELDRERLENATAENSIVLRGMSRAHRARGEALTWRMVSALRRAGERLNEGDERDLWHLAAAVALGARYFVSSDRKLCSWINTVHRNRLDRLARQYFNRPLPYCINWEEGECPSGAQAPRLLQGATRQAQSGRRGSPRRENPRSNRRVGQGKDKLARGRKKARGAGKKERKGKVAEGGAARPRGGSPPGGPRGSRGMTHA